MSSMGFEPKLGPVKCVLVMKLLKGNKIFKIINK